MQNSKFLGLAALVLGIGAALAFTQPETSDRSNHLDPTEFKYIGPANPDINDATNPENYDPVTDPCLGSGNLCSIVAEPSSGDPDDPEIQNDPALMSALNAFFQSGTSSPLIIEKN